MFFTCVLIVFGVRSGSRRWFWIAFAYKTAIDAFAVWASLGSGMLKTVAGWISFEVEVGLFAAFALAVLAHLRERFQSLTAADAAPPLDATSDRPPSQGKTTDAD